MATVDVKYRVNYSLISWSGGKVSRHFKDVTAESSEKAQQKVEVLTKGKGFNYIVQVV